VPVVLYGKYIVRVFQNRERNVITVPKGEEITEGWRKLHNGMLNNGHPLCNIVVIIKLAGM
jgi:hypothetical protein